MITSKAATVKSCQFQSSNITYNVKKGELFLVEVIALDQVNHPVKATIISHLHLPSKLEKSQYSQSISDKCTNLSFNVYSLNDSEELYIYPNTQCGYKENSKALHVNIVFKKCTCPAGFYVLQNQLKDCRCACDLMILTQYTDLLQCNSSTVVRRDRY